MSTLEHALTLHRAGKLAEAQSIYQQLSINEQEGHAYATNMLGLIAFQQNRADEALALLHDSTQRDPANAELWINQGEIQRRAGRLDDAIESLQKAVELAPDNPHAHYNLGVALRDARGPAAPEPNGDSAVICAGSIYPSPIPHFQRATELAPAMSEAWNNLALALLDERRPAEALHAAQTLLQWRPAAPEANTNLARALFEVGRHAEALQYFQKAITLNPQFATGWANLGSAQKSVGNRPEALEAYERAVELEPNNPEYLRELGMVLYSFGNCIDAEINVRAALELIAGRPGEAETRHVLALILAASNNLPESLAQFDLALKLNPAAEHWRFEADALRGKQLQQAPESFVRGLFDNYAPRFEKHLTGTLNYDAPQALVQLALNHLRTNLSMCTNPNPSSPEIAIPGTTPSPSINASPTPPTLDILDLGCGTGLCGQLFRPHAKHITGVDLSPKMIQLSRARRDNSGRPIYDALLTADITTAMLQLFAQNQTFDLITAADVFIYVGALERIFPAAFQILRPQGLLAFSVENHPGPEDFSLTIHRRFAHSVRYIEKLARANAFKVAHVQNAHIRNDVPEGRLVLLQRA